MNGGYIMIKASDADIYASASRALTIGKPILFYENDTTCYYIDTITLDGTNVVLTKGGKTITIANDNTITTSGDIINPLMENIKDAKGHLRFIEGELEVQEVEGYTFTYGKYSLSGTHLMIVLAGNVLNTTVSATTTKLADVPIPDWIIDKIYPITSSRVISFTISYWAPGNQQTQQATLRKLNDKIHIQTDQSLTLNDDRSFRIQLDLLIDNA